MGMKEASVVEQIVIVAGQLPGSVCFQKRQRLLKKVGQLVGESGEHASVCVCNWQHRLVVR